MTASASPSPNPAEQNPSSFTRQRVVIEATVTAVVRRERRDRRGSFTVLTIANPDFQEAVCFNGVVPFVVEVGQKVRVRGRPEKYEGKSQLVFFGSDIKLIALAADNPDFKPPADLVSIEVTVGRINRQVAGSDWKAFVIAVGGFESASGSIPFPIYVGQRLRLRGRKGEFRGKPQLVIERAEPLGVDYADDRKRIFTALKLQADYCARLEKALGPDFAAMVCADAGLIGEHLSGTKSATRKKIVRACELIVNQEPFAAALRQCGVNEKTVALLTEKYPQGLSNISPYDLTDYTLLDESETRGPRCGLTGGEADKLAQSDYALRLRPFDPQTLIRARCHVERLARDRIELWGDIGASIASIVADLGKQYAFSKTVAEKAVADLALARTFTLDPTQPDRLWLTSEERAEQAIADSVRARLRPRPITGERKRRDDGR
jgi:hypothetical protein